MIDIQNTRAILIGVSEYKDTYFQNAPPIKNNVLTFKKLLMDKNILGLNESDILLLNQNQSDSEILEQTEEFIQNSWDYKYIFYFAGHGYKTEKGDFHLVCHNTSKNRIERSSIHWSEVKELFEKGNGIQQRFYILDACHSGAASLGEQDKSLELAKGSVLIAAADADAEAYFDPKDEYTHFTAALFDVLKTGLPNLEASELSAKSIFHYLENKLKKKEFKVTQKETHKISDVNFFKNPAFDKIAVFLKEAELHLKNTEFGKAKELYKEAVSLCVEREEYPRAKKITDLRKEAEKSQKLFATFRQKIQKENQTQITQLNKLLQNKEAELKKAVQKEELKYQELLRDKNTIQEKLNAKTETLRRTAGNILADNEKYNKLVQDKADLEKQIKTLENTLALRDRSITDLKTLLKERKTKLEVFGREIIQLKKQIQNLKTPQKAKIQTQSTNIFTQKIKNTSFEMLKVEGGSFKMGSNEEQDEQPVHDVSLDTFYMAKHQVTQKLWKEVMGDNPSHFKGDDLPVEKVSWNDAQDFITKLNNLTKKEYHLPTEAQWEYAAGGVSKNRTKYAGTNSESDLKNYAWFGENSESKTHKVGTRNPNQLGLCDMSGNVWEWCQDKWHDNYKNAPKNGSAWENGNSSYRVLRGGSWSSYASGCRVANRHSRSPSFRSNYLGFRMVLLP